MGNNTENIPERSTDNDKELSELLTKWADEKLRPMYETYPDAGQVIPCFLFGIKYADELREFEPWGLAFMARRAGLTGERSKAGAIGRGIALSQYVALRENTDIEWENSLKALIEELETKVVEIKGHADQSR